MPNFRALGSKVWQAINHIGKKKGWKEERMNGIVGERRKERRKKGGKKKERWEKGGRRKEKREGKKKSRKEK